MIVETYQMDILDALAYTAILIGAFFYYMIFGKNTLSPSVHRHVSRKRFLDAVAEVFSYGLDGAQIKACVAEGGQCILLEKRIRQKDDVHLVYVGPRALPVSDDVVVLGADPETRATDDITLDFQENTQAAAQFAFDTLVALGMSEYEGCYLEATGVSLSPKHGWSKGNS